MKFAVFFVFQHATDASTANGYTGASASKRVDLQIEGSIWQIMVEQAGR